MVKRSQLVNQINLVWETPEEFTSNDTFTAPTDAPLNANGKVECFVTAQAGGGGGGASPGAAADCTMPQGGQAGDWCFRYKVELDPGESVAVTIGAAGTASSPGTNGGSTSFGAYLTLSGGVGAANGNGSAAVAAGYNPSNGGAIISGSISGDNAIHEGNAGGQGATVSGSALGAEAYDGMSMILLGAYVGLSEPAGSGNPAGGGGGAGLWGHGKSEAHTPGANSGSGGAGGEGFSQAGHDGSAGRLRVEWKVAA